MLCRAIEESYNNVRVDMFRDRLYDHLIDWFSIPSRCTSMMCLAMASSVTGLHSSRMTKNKSNLLIIDKGDNGHKGDVNTEGQ